MHPQNPDPNALPPLPASPATASSVHSAISVESHPPLLISDVFLNADEVFSQDDLFTASSDTEEIEVNGASGSGGCQPILQSELQPSISIDESPSLSSSLEKRKAMPLAAAGLAESAATDPKKYKRNLVNLKCEARSEERRKQYISDLEQEVETLRSKKTRISAQISVQQTMNTGLHAENMGITSQLQVMGQEAQMGDGIHKALNLEISRLKNKAGKIVNPSYQQMPGQQQDPLEGLQQMPASRKHPGARSAASNIQVRGHQQDPHKRLDIGNSENSSSSGDSCNNI